ncbi:MAG: hypothetical protein U5L96_09460 [Owenweeksia sp.]|nr:hypothetical protein [Owenweeksia sp.]
MASGWNFKTLADADWQWLRNQNMDAWLGDFDMSDAGMMYWLISGGPNGGCDTCGTRQVEKLFNNPCYTPAQPNLEVAQIDVHLQQDTLSIDSRIKNTGDTAAANWKIGFFASTDAQIDTSDIFLGDTVINNLSKLDSIDVHFKPALPASSRWARAIFTKE